VAFALVAVSALVGIRRALAGAGPRRALRATFLGVEALLALVIAIDLWTAAAPLLEHHDHVIARGPAKAAFVQRAGADYGQLPSFPVWGQGTRQCYTPIEWKPAAGVVEGDGPQARLEPAGAGKLAQTAWTPNAISFTADLTAPALLVVNQNYESGWRSSDGEVVAFRGPGQPPWRSGQPAPAGPQAIGLLAVSLPAGHHDLRVAHRPRGLAAGVALSVVGLALAALILRRLTPEARARLRNALARLVRGPTSPSGS
jgi:hypothetical protein